MDLRQILMPVVDDLDGYPARVEHRPQHLEGIGWTPWGEVPPEAEGDLARQSGVQKIARAQGDA